MKSYLWTKLLLDKDAAKGQWDDPSLKEYFGSGVLALPPGKSAESVCSDYMACLYKHFVARIEHKVKLDITPMEVWITVPAIWSDLAKQSTLKAAERAGFGARRHLGDTTSVITEPEAAALTILKPRLDSTLLFPASVCVHSSTAIRQRLTSSSTEQEHTRMRLRGRDSGE